MLPGTGGGALSGAVGGSSDFLPSKHLAQEDTRKQEEVTSDHPQQHQQRPQKIQEIYNYKILQTFPWTQTPSSQSLKCWKPLKNTKPEKPLTH